MVLEGEMVPTDGFEDSEQVMDIPLEEDENMEVDEGFYEEENAPNDGTPKRQAAMDSRDILPTPLRTPKTPFKTPYKGPTKTPRVIPKSAFASAKKHKKKKPRKSQLDISALTDEQVALAALQSSQILHMKLRKRYYAEALNFIRQVEGAMEIIGQLLGSTNKAEVLESIEFFRIAYEYQFEGAEVSPCSYWVSPSLIIFFSLELKKCYTSFGQKIITRHQKTERNLREFAPDCLNVIAAYISIPCLILNRSSR